MKRITEKLYLCDCGAHCLLIEDYSSKDFPEIDMCFMEKFGDKINWKEQLRWIWQIIRHGTPWVDSIQLDYWRTEQLGKDLVKIGKAGQKRFDKENEKSKKKT